MSQIITVIGSDCMVGAAVAKALKQYYQVRAIPLLSHDFTDKLRSFGVEIHTPDVTNVNSVVDVLHGSHGCFVCTISNLSDPHGQQTEEAHGRMAAKACLAAGVQHVVLNTQLSVVRLLGSRATHMDAKAAVEEYMKSHGVQVTSVIIPMLYQELLIPPFRPKRKNHYTFVVDLPMGRAPLDLIAADDVGVAVTSIFQQGGPTVGRTMSLSGNKLSIHQIANILTNNLAPRVFEAQGMTVEQYRSTGMPGATDLSYMFDFYSRVEQKTSMDLTKQLCPGMLSLDMWLQQNAGAVAQAMDVECSPPTEQIWSKQPTSAGGVPQQQRGW